MKKTEALILERGDMHKESYKKEIGEIKFSDFQIPFCAFTDSNVILFMDNSDHTLYSRILKNRWADKGNGMVVRDLKRLEQTNDQDIREALKNLIEKYENQ